MDLSQKPYVSCIKIGKQPIIPPLLTEEMKNEMRYYRDLAVSVEKRKKIRRNSTDSGVMISSNDGSCPKKVDASNAFVNNSLPTPDVNNDLILSFCDSSAGSDQDNVFIETNMSPSTLTHLNSCAKTNSPDASTDNNEEHISERRNSYTINTSQVIAFEGSEIPAASERRNSYTLDSPSPIMLQYLRSLQNNDSTEKYELFIQSSDNDGVPQVIISDNSLENNERKELKLEDLFINSREYEDYQLSRLDMWDACSNETLHKFLEADLRKFESVRSSICNSPESVVRACTSTECIKNAADEVNAGVELNNESVETVAAANGSCECICNIINKFEPLRSQYPDCITPVKDHCNDNDNDDSFNRDFRQLDLSNLSCDEPDAFIEGRYSECSSVSLNKFLSGDKFPDKLETEYAAFSYMKEQLEMKHRNEFKRLLKEQQKEHDNLKVQFSRILLQPKRAPSSKCNYAYSDGIVLKKYAPSEQSTPMRACSLAEDYLKRTNGTPKKTINVEKKRKILTENTDLNMIMMEAATKINAAVRGFLTRRLFKTERVTLLVQTIKDCLATAVSLQSETNLQLSELDLQSRLLQQLTVACNDLHGIFSLPLRERMPIIAADREKKIRNSSKKRTPLPLSEATRRTLQRKILANSAPPPQLKCERRRCRSVSSTTSESTSCRSTPGSRRRLTAAIMSQKFSVSVGGRRPWR